MLETQMTAPAGLPRYRLPDDALEYGASLGNAHCWLTTRGNGSIQQFFSTDAGQIIAGSISIRYGSTGHPLLRASAEQIASAADTSVVQLRPSDAGTIELHPAYQSHTFPLSEELRVQETVFVPLATGDDPPVCYCLVRVSNVGSVQRRLNVYAFARLGGTFASDITARYDEDMHGLIAAERNNPSSVRIFGCTQDVTAHETNHDFGGVYDIYHVSQLCNQVDAIGDILGALQVELSLQPGEASTMAFVMAYAHSGEVDAVATYRNALDAERTLHDTIAYLERMLTTAQVLTPDQTINEGVLWSKVNMLRVMARYPQGPAFTNDPGVSSNVVARDAAWWVYGNDHFLPEFSRNLLDTFARLQDVSGKIVEFYSAVDGHTDDYQLNINDDTPLFMLAVNHHFRATGDLAWLRAIYPAVAHAARYIMSQRDERGLIYCSARDPRGSMWAIASWRNVIPDYSLSGAVTEINAECVAALRAAGHLAKNLGDGGDEAELFFSASDQLREAMNTQLINPRNGLYLLTIDTGGVDRTDVTGDQIFPVIFRACPEEVGFRIIRRLNHPDFWTVAGLRTISADDPLYDPAKNLGLLGGVWPGLTWWFAFAAARYHPELMVEALRASFAHYARDPKTNSTVPGQFSEWFDGESLVNRGMRLSPWEPPRFLWAAIEGVCGVVLQPGKPKIQPLIPATWRWVALRRLPYHGTEISYFAAREEQHVSFHIYSTAEVATDHVLELFDEDATHLARVLDPAVCHMVLRRPGKTVMLLGHTSTSTSIVTLDLTRLLEPDMDYRVRLYDSEAYLWHQSEMSRGEAVSMCAVTIDAGGFRILIFEEEAAN